MPEHIINDAGKLNPEAMMKMKTHPLVGARMIGHIRGFKNIARWIGHHHERYDGTGYPLGLKGSDIPVPAQIITIVDMFDALTSERSYRKALSDKDALQTMREHVSTFLEPELFNSFVGMVEHTGKKHNTSVKVPLSKDSVVGLP